MISARFIEAVRFATIKHAKQRRMAANRTHIPYMVHPLETAQILVETCSVAFNSISCTGMYEDILIAAILHDTLEDTDATDSEITNLFGYAVLAWVRENTDDPKLDKMAQKHMQVVNAPKKSLQAAMIKCADKTSNMRDIVRVPPPWAPEKIKAYVQQAREVVEGLNTGDRLPKDLVAAFWKASQDALDAATEAEIKLKEVRVLND